MARGEERGALNEPALSHTPYLLVDPVQHERLAARGRLCRTALLVSSVMVIGSVFATTAGLDARDAASLPSLLASRRKKRPAPLSVKDPVDLGYPPLERAGAGAPTKLWSGSIRRKARPTCAWWENFALGDGQAPNANVFAAPYILTIGAGIVVDYPSATSAGEHIFQSVASLVEQVTLGAREIKPASIISEGVGDRGPFGDARRHLSDSQLCNEIPRPTCGAPHELCFRDDLCPGGGPGCGAGGNLQCRFCGFGDFDPCPASSGPSPLEPKKDNTGRGPSPPPPPPPAAPAAKAPPAGRPIIYSRDHVVSGYDALVVNVSFASGAAVAPLLQGSPYVTMLYDGSLTPMLSAQMAGSATEVDGKKVACGKGMKPVVGSKFRVEFAQADSAWVAYASEPVEWDCRAATALNFTVVTEKFAGSVRLALANNCSAGSDPHHRCSVRGQPDDHSAYEALLDRHAAAVPVAGLVSHSVAPSAHDNGQASVELDYAWSLAPRPNASQEAGGAELLMLALPHQHRSMAPAPLPSSKGMHRTVRGAALAVVGNSWTITYTAPLPSFEATTPIDPAMLPAIRSSLLNGTRKDSSDADLRFDLPINFQGGIADPYFAGKLLAKMAYIATIANTSAVGLGKEAAKLLPKLKQYLEVWLHHKSGNVLMFDTSWGGMISCGCQYDDCQGQCAPRCTNAGPPDACPAVNDVGMDFGNAWYNDHHFHYGYYIYAYAVLAAFDPKWGAKNLEHILVMVRDIANPSKDDHYFPVHRHKDWYMGHSWASGIAVPGGKPNFLGRNQESTSEAVNAWYAISLLGKVVGRDDVRDLGMALLATEIKSAQTYWHTSKGSDIYPADFARGAAVGMLWSSLAQQQTWFGVAPYYIHGIQMLPFTPASEALLEPEWLATETPVYAASCSETCVQQGWSVPLRLAQAVQDPSGALAAVKKLPAEVFDSANAGGNGNSRTASYYWIATRPVLPSATKLVKGAWPSSAEHAMHEAAVHPELHPAAAPGNAAPGNATH